MGFNTKVFLVKCTCDGPLSKEGFGHVISTNNHVSDAVMCVLISVYYSINLQEVNLTVVNFKVT